MMSAGFLVSCVLERSRFDWSWSMLPVDWVDLSASGFGSAIIERVQGCPSRDADW